MQLNCHAYADASTSVDTDETTTTVAPAGTSGAYGVTWTHDTDFSNTDLLSLTDDITSENASGIYNSVCPVDYSSISAISDVIQDGYRIVCADYTYAYYDIIYLVEDKYDFAFNLADYEFLVSTSAQVFYRAYGIFNFPGSQSVQVVYLNSTNCSPGYLYSPSSIRLPGCGSMYMSAGSDKSVSYKGNYGSYTYKTPYINTDSITGSILGELSYTYKSFDSCVTLINSNYDDFNDLAAYIDFIENGGCYSSTYDSNVPFVTDVRFSESSKLLTLNNKADLLNYVNSNGIDNSYIDISLSGVFSSLSLDSYLELIEGVDNSSVTDGIEDWGLGIGYLNTYFDYYKFKETDRHTSFGDHALNYLFMALQAKDGTLTYDTFMDQVLLDSENADDAQSAHNLKVPFVHCSTKDINSWLSSSNNSYNSSLDLDIDKLVKVAQSYALFQGCSPLIRFNTYVFKLAHVVSKDGEFYRSEYRYLVVDWYGMSMLLTESDAVTYGYLPKDYDSSSENFKDIEDLNTNGYMTTDSYNTIYQNYNYNYYGASSGSGGGSSSDSSSDSSSSATGGEGGKGGSAIGINGDAIQENNQSIGDIVIYNNDNNDNDSSTSVGGFDIVSPGNASDTLSSLWDGFDDGFGMLGDNGLVAALSHFLAFVDPGYVIRPLLLILIAGSIIIGIIRLIRG